MAYYSKFKAASAYRRAAQSVICLLAMFAIVSCAVPLNDAAGKINGKTITKDEFYSSYRGHYAMFSYQNGRSPDSAEKINLFNETWTNISRAVILKDYFRKYKITANVREVLDTLSTNIPAHILASPRFQVNGKFERKSYLQSLTTDRPENLSALRKQYQEYLIPIQKLKIQLIENELISSGDSKRCAQILSGSADLELHLFDAANLNIRISESEIANYYQANLAAYRLQPYLKLNYCKIDVIPDETDQKNSQAIADSIRLLLDKGYSAEELAGTTSEASISFLDHGYEKTAELPENIAAILATLQDGQSSAPQARDKGWIIYQKVQSTKTLTLYRSIYVQSYPRSSSLIAPETHARRVMNLALNVGLESAADEFNLELYRISPQNPDSLALPASDLAKTIRKLKTAPTGSILEPVYSAELSAWVIFEVAENQTRDYLPLSDAAASIKSILAEKLKLGYNEKRVKAWLANPQSAESDSVITLKDINYYSTVPGLPLGRLLFLAVSAHLQKQGAVSVAQGEQIIVPIVKSWKAGQNKATPQEIQAAYAASQNPDWFDKWLDEKLKQAKLIKYINP